MAAVDMKKRLALFGSAPATLDFMLSDMQTAGPPDIGIQLGQLRLLEAWGHPELVVLDNLSSLAGFTGDPDRWQDLLQRFLMLQRRFGRAVLMVHHANKKGLQRGTNRREDVLDIVMSLRRPLDYAAREGARFEIHFDKARGLHGDAVEPIEAQLETDMVGVARWQWRQVQESLVSRVAALLNEGLSTPKMAERSESHGPTPIGCAIEPWRTACCRERKRDPLARLCTHKAVARSGAGDVYNTLKSRD